MSAKILGKKKEDKEKEKGVMEWIKAAKFDPEKGELTIGGRRHAIVFNGFYSDMRERMREVIGNAADAIIYDVAKEHVKAVVLYYMNHFPPLKLLAKTKKGRDAVANKVVDLLSAYGYGKGTLEKLDWEGESVIVVENSFVATWYVRNNIKTDKPVCSLLRGFIAGAAEAIGGRKLDCIETECVAKGDKVCRFVVKPAE